MSLLYNILNKLKEHNIGLSGFSKDRNYSTVIVDPGTTLPVGSTSKNVFLPLNRKKTQYGFPSPPNSAYIEKKIKNGSLNHMKSSDSANTFIGI
ncbi:hypothetical protein BB561_002007 [Smittium simulii]|uniref:Uncharacterized protein n=1 Tax=Smittium simulii TaxID=133385 RepID=A0A2T9YRY6_9FUNG|nr:hypothetical protein BB561_002007 [Smittium simulii]